MEVLIFIFWVLLPLIPANIANKKGYDFVSWFLYGIVLFPIAFFHSIFLRKNEDELLKKEKKYNIQNGPLSAYYIGIKNLYVSGVLFLVQDFIISNKDDSYDLTSYKLDLIVPIYDGYGRIERKGVLFNSEYVLFVAYSIKTKEGSEEKNQVLIHVFNGINGGFAYIENDEKQIYENKIKTMVDENGKNVIELLTSLLMSTTTVDLIKQIEEELTQQIKNEQAQATGEAIGASIGAAILGASAANLGRSVRQLGRSI